MIVMGLTGKAGAGKSAVADYLVEQYGFTKLSFAGPLKKMLRTLDPILEGGDHDLAEPTRLSHVSHHPEDYIKRAYPEYRRLLQTLGTDCIRALDEDFWVRAAMQQLTDLNGRYVFDDVRFPNEASAAYLRGKKPALWHIVRPNNFGGAGTHESEQWAGKMGEAYRIENSDDLEALHGQIANLLMHTVGVPA